MSGETTLTLTVSGLSVADAKKLAEELYKLAEEDPTRHYRITVVQGLQGKPAEEVKKILHEIFPPGGMAS